MREFFKLIVFGLIMFGLAWLWYDWKESKPLPEIWLSSSEKTVRLGPSFALHFADSPKPKPAVHYVDNSAREVLYVTLEWPAKSEGLPYAVKATAAYKGIEFAAGGSTRAWALGALKQRWDELRR